MRVMLKRIELERQNVLFLKFVEISEEVCAFLLDVLENGLFTDFWQRKFMDCLKGHDL